MLAYILVVLFILIIISRFKAKYLTKWLVILLGIVVFYEAVAFMVWLSNIKKPEELVECKNVSKTLEGQKNNLKKELLQGNVLTEEELDVILENYLELEKQIESNNEKIEDCQSWIEGGRERLESVIFF